MFSKFVHVAAYILLVITLFITLFFCLFAAGSPGQREIFTIAAIFSSLVGISFSLILITLSKILAKLD